MGRGRIIDLEAKHPFKIGDEVYICGPGNGLELEGPFTIEGVSGGLKFHPIGTYYTLSNGHRLWHDFCFLALPDTAEHYTYANLNSERYIIGGPR